MDRKSTRNTRDMAGVPDAGNVVGADPHKHTVTASVLDERGGVLGTGTFRVSGDGHRAMEAWALEFGPIARWGIEGAGGLGRHTAMYLIGQGHDVRDVCPNRTAEQSRRRRDGKTDALDSARVARETQADPAMPTAFKRAAGDAGPDETHELLALWHNARRSILKSRQHLLNEAEHLLNDLPEALRAELPETSEVRARLRALAHRDASAAWDPATTLRLRLLDGHTATVADLDAQDREAATELRRLGRVAGSTLHELCGIAERIEAELLVEVGDPRRFTGEGGFARFNGTAPLPGLLSRRRRGAGPSPAQSGRQPPSQRVPAPHGRDPAALRTPRSQDLRQRPSARPHQERSHAHPQTTPQRCRLPAHDPRPPGPPGGSGTSPTGRLLT